MKKKNMKTKKFCKRQNTSFCRQKWLSEDKNCLLVAKIYKDFFIYCLQNDF